MARNKTEQDSLFRVSSRLKWKGSEMSHRVRGRGITASGGMKVSQVWLIVHNCTSTWMDPASLNVFTKQNFLTT